LKNDGRLNEEVRLLWWIAGALAADGLSPETRGKEAEAAYSLALDLVVEHRYTEACAALSRVVADYPATPAATAARDERRQVAAVAPDAGCANQHTSEDNGAVELVVTQTLVWPITLGVLLPSTSDHGFDAPTGPVLGAFAGLAVGLGGSLALAHRYPVSAGEAMSVFTGQGLGFSNAMYLAERMGGEGRTVATVGFLGVLGGTAAGGLIAAKLHPNAGQVSVVRSGATWGATVGVISLLIVEPGPTERGVLRPLAFADVGAIVTTGLAIWKPDLSRGRMNVIDLGGYTGAVIAGGLVILASGGDPERAPTGIALLTGIAGGLAIGAVLTRRFESGPLGRGNDTMGLDIGGPAVLPEAGGGWRGIWQLGGAF
jgi:hypothetical protein